MNPENVRAKVTIQDEEQNVETTIPLYLSLPTIQLLVEDCLVSNLKITIKPIQN